ncbi:STAS domain-containing protein [Mycobacterium neglectum]|uniref:STAS domain-containing protein n=1 Tax=Mycobacterium neglectum TaxID=242737 RepID=UPI003183060D
MGVHQDDRGTGLVLSVRGDIDSASVATLVSHLDDALKTALDHPARLLVLELSAVTYFGSAGLNAVLQCYEQGLSIGVAVRLVAPTVVVTRPIEITKLDGVLRLYRTVPDAIEGT